MQIPPVVGNMLRFALILCGGVLVSAHIRLKITIGAPLGDGYQAFPLILLVLIAASAAIAAVLRPYITLRHPKFADFAAALVADALASAAIILLVPDLSQIQVLYFALGSAVIAGITLVLTPRKHSLRESLYLLWENRSLFALSVRYNVMSRYSQTALGILWIVMLPVATSIILTFVFSFIFRPGDIGNVPFISFFLAGLLFWNLFTQSVLNGSTSIVQNLGLINQIYFPREILVLVKLGEAMVDLSFVFVVTLVINLIVGIVPNANFIYLPVLLCIQLALVLGIIFFTSYLTVIIRDVQQLITVFIQLLFYLTPLMYPIDVLPENIAEVVTFLNPLAALVSAYRDVIIYNRPPDFESLYFAIALSGVLLYSGYMFFKANEKKLADFR